MDTNSGRKFLCMISAVLLALGLLPLRAFAAAGEPFYIGNAIHYADTNDSLYLNEPITYQTDNITMEAWVKPDTLSVGTTNIRIMYNGHSSDSGYGIYLYGANKNPSILMGGVQFVVAGNSTIETGKWCHLAAVRRSGIWELYINGNQAAFTVGSAAAAPNIPGLGEGFSIGNNALVPESFIGCFDEVRFWSVARTAQQIRENMYIKLGSGVSGLLAYYDFDQPGAVANEDNTAINEIINFGTGGAALNMAVSDGFEMKGTISNFVPSVQLGTFSFENASYTVNEDAGKVTATITRTSQSEGSVTIGYSAADGTALAGTNYTAPVNQSVTFAAGETSKTIDVNIINTGELADDKTFSIKLSAPTGVTIAIPETTVTIQPLSTVDISGIPGVAAPVTGQTGTAVITASSQYTGTVTWSPSSAFEAGTVYTAAITLTPKAGYSFKGVPENFFTVAGAAATNSAGSGIVTAVFPGTPYAAPLPGVGYSIDYSNETISVTDGYEVSSAADFSALIASGSSIENYIGQSLYVRKAAGGTIPASAGTSFSVPARPSAPSGIGTVNESYPNAGDGQITGVDDAMEYKTEDGSWTGIAAAPITGLAGGTYYVRYRSGASAFSSQAAAITVATTGTTQEAAPNAGINYEEEKLTGLTASAVYLIDGVDYSADANGTIPIQAGWIGNASFSIVKKGNGTTTTNSEPQNLPIPVRPSAPQNAEGVSPSISGGTGSIIGVDDTMEYNDGSSDWTPITGDTVTGLTPGKYYVRYSANNDANQFAGLASEVNVGEFVPVITASAGIGGSIAPNGEVSVTEGESQTFSITPENGYHITSVRVDGINRGAISSYTFTNVTEGHTISAAFAENSHSLPTFFNRTLTDSVSGITVKGEYIHKDAKLTAVNKYEDCDVIRAARASGRLIKALDIDLGQGFYGPITISVPVGSQYNGQTVSIHHCGGTPETIDVLVINGMATFRTTSLSVFAVISNDTGISDPPKTGDGTALTGFVLLGLGIAFAFLFAMKRHRA